MLESWKLVIVTAVLLVHAATWAAAHEATEEFKVKRAETFEFAQPPRLTRDGDRIEIAFSVKANCDATVAVEDAAGKIVRHLASGVLGENAPPPFAKNSLDQKLVWDGKDDQGRYIDDKDSHSVRVSLGLKPQFEKDLYASPYKRFAWEPPVIAPGPEGVYVYEGRGIETLRLFDHDGKYLRTLYPFAAGKLDAVKGLPTVTYPQDGATLPQKSGAYQNTFLLSGPNSKPKELREGLWGSAATAMAAGGSRVVLAETNICRLAPDGTSGGLPLQGPKVSVSQSFFTIGEKKETGEVGPTSAALSPDGRYLYLAGYRWDKLQQHDFYQDWHCLHGVMRLEVAKDEAPVPFAGTLTDEGHGQGEGQFRCATSVACDGQGRVYVSDYMNDRIQVFSPEGKYLSSVASPKPAQVCVGPKSGEIHVFSWMLANPFLKDQANAKIPATLTVYSGLDAPKKVASVALPLEAYSDRIGGGSKGGGRGHFYRAQMDFGANPPRVWLVPGFPHFGSDKGAVPNLPWEKIGIRVFEFDAKAGRLALKLDFGQEALKATAKATPPAFGRQRLAVNPATGHLLVADERGFSKAVVELVEVDPDSGKCKAVELPFDAEDFAFDAAGLVYARTHSLLCRFDPGRGDATTGDWAEVPFDYGEERQNVMTSSLNTPKKASIISGVPLPAATNAHHGGMCVSLKGHIAVACTVKIPGGMAFLEAEKRDKEVTEGGTPYRPQLYPGRPTFKKFALFNVWDKHGKLMIEDHARGLPIVEGVGLDQEDNLYVMTGGVRVYGGKPHFNLLAGTMMKFAPGKGRIVSTHMAPIPMNPDAVPKRPPDVKQGYFTIHDTWAEGVDWMYGGVGLFPKNTGICECSNARFAFDCFNRSFAPEIDRCQVAVLDASGNLIVRLGRMGNVDSAGEKSAVPLGSDEISLFYAPYLATHTDKRLFIADIGNQRVISVKLGYHAEQRLLLKDVADVSQ